jgi:hypothetical protein
MPYRIKARSEKGHTVTRMDLDYTHRPIMDRAVAQELADEFARTRPHGNNGKQWKGIVEHYEKSIANPLWDRSNGSIRNPYDKKK